LYCSIFPTRSPRHGRLLLEISHTEGATFGPHPTVEDIAGNWELIREGSLPNELDGEAMAWGVKAYSGRLQGLAVQLQAAEVIR
jgi:hypothetical protein